MDETPEIMWPGVTAEGRWALAGRLGLTIGPYSQDWEWEVARAEDFGRWLAVYRDEPLSDAERVSLMEILVQCVDLLRPAPGQRPGVARLPEWKAVRALLLERPRLHAGTMAYWSAGSGFRVSRAMRRVWEAVRPTLG